jgi:molecular chaperone GrpE
VENEKKENIEESAKVNPEAPLEGKSGCCNSSKSEESCKKSDKSDERENELVLCKAQLLRVSADLQNLKRRVEKERAEWGVMGQLEVLSHFLPVVDDFVLAMSAAESSDLNEHELEWFKGFKLIQDKLGLALESSGAKEINCDGKFDPELHEALISVESEDVESENIVAVLRKGYQFKGRVLRHAQVSVAK